MSGVEEGLISEGALLRLVRTIQQKAPSSFPMTLVSLLDELEKNTQEPDGHQTEGKTGCDQTSCVKILIQLLTSQNFKNTSTVNNRSAMFILCS